MSNEEEEFMQPDVPQNLADAGEDLLAAQIRLAAIEGRIDFEDLMFVRRLIAVAFDQVKSLREKLIH